MTEEAATCELRLAPLIGRNDPVTAVCESDAGIDIKEAVMATSMDGAIVIARPVDDVYRFVTDAANDSRWQPTVRESHSTPAGPWGVNTRIIQRRHFAGFRFKMKWHVLAVEPNHLVHSRFGGVMARGEGDYGFEAVATGTRFRMVVAGRARWWNLPLEPLLRSRAKLEVQTSLLRLKSLMEESG